MEREHPIGTERKSLTKSADGRVETGGGLTERKNGKSAESEKLLTGIGLLMEGLMSRGSTERSSGDDAPRENAFYSARNSVEGSIRTA